MHVGHLQQHMEKSELHQGLPRVPFHSDQCVTHEVCYCVEVIVVTLKRAPHSSTQMEIPTMDLSHMLHQSVTP